MSNQQTVTLGFGKLSLPLTWVVLSAQRVQAPFLRDSGSNSGKRVRDSYREYMIGAIPHYGTLYNVSVEHAAGEILLLQASWKRKGVPIRDGAIFLRLRETGNLWRISAKLPTERENHHGASAVVFEGRADMLTPAMLAARGIEAPRSYRDKFMSEEEVDECFKLEILSAEASPPPNLMVVQDGKNTKVVEVANAPARRMTFRTKKG